MNQLISGFNSVYGILNSLGALSMIYLTAESVLSFPFASMWLCIQHIRISLELDIESNLLNNLMIKRSSRFQFFLVILRERVSLRI